jgi:hypothetical protein
MEEAQQRKKEDKLKRELEDLEQEARLLREREEIKRMEQDERERLDKKTKDANERERIYLEGQLKQTQMLEDEKSKKKFTFKRTMNVESEPQT